MCGWPQAERTRCSGCIYATASRRELEPAQHMAGAIRGTRNRRRSYSGSGAQVHSGQLRVKRPTRYGLYTRVVASMMEARHTSASLYRCSISSDYRRGSRSAAGTQNQRPPEFPESFSLSSMTPQSTSDRAAAHPTVREPAARHLVCNIGDPSDQLQTSAYCTHPYAISAAVLGPLSCMFMRIPRAPGTGLICGPLLNAEVPILIYLCGFWRTRAICYDG